MTDVRKDELVVINGGATLNVPTKTGSCNRSAVRAGLRASKSNRSLIVCSAALEPTRSNSTGHRTPSPDGVMPPCMRSKLSSCLAPSST